MRSGGTSARMVFASFEYTTAPPLKYSLEPACAVRTAARSPPVHDSAAATVSLRRRRREWIAPIRSSSSGRVGGRLFGTQHESDAREHGERCRRHEQRVRGRGEPRGWPDRSREQHGDRGDLQDRLSLAVRARTYGLRRAGADLNGDELTGEDQYDRPRRRDPPTGKGRQGTGDEDLVRARIEGGAERRRAAATREGSIQRISAGGAEEDEKRERRVARRDQTDHGDDKDGTGRAQRVRERHCATKTRSTTPP